MTEPFFSITGAIGAGISQHDTGLLLFNPAMIPRDAVARHHQVVQLFTANGDRRFSLRKLQSFLIIVQHQIRTNRVGRLAGRPHRLTVKRT
jgi:hypothetical protein